MKIFIKFFGIVLLLVGASTQTSYSQRIAVKTNAIDWATLSPNVGFEVRLSQHFTLDFEASFNYFITNNLKPNYLRVQPELRYWFSRPMVSHFVGITGYYSLYNFQYKRNHYDGDAWAAGVTYGYVYPLSRHWNMEATIGVGVVKLRTMKYVQGENRSDSPNYSPLKFAPVKLGLAFSYLF